MSWYFLFFKKNFFGEEIGPDRWYQNIANYPVRLVVIKRFSSGPSTSLTITKVSNRSKKGIIVSDRLGSEGGRLGGLVIYGT